jgi:NTP pyrophosphatase (non-canonical NTP hydrolase)
MFGIGRMGNNMTQETINQILKFRDDRDWKQFHNPKDLAISISLEASELLEVFQWSGADTSSNNKIEEIKEELADVVNYCVLMADACGLDLDEIVQTKIEKNNEKYPVEKSKGKSDKYDKL